MSKSKSSARWLQEHFKDKYVQQSQKDGYRSRASYKLIEIDDRDNLIRANCCVIDLGSAPGGWSQVAVKRVGHRGRVIASDILGMDSMAGVEFIQGDFTQDEVFNKIVETVADTPVDLVISDMAPNLSGVKAVDQPKSMYLTELAMDMALLLLKPGGSFISKVFMGEGTEEFYKETRKRFTKVVTRKPDASRARSSEVYIVAKGFKG